MTYRHFYLLDTVTRIPLNESLPIQLITFRSTSTYVYNTKVNLFKTLNVLMCDIRKTPTTFRLDTTGT